VTGILERLVEAGYQCCLVDPEGDYEQFEDAIILGGAERPPTSGEVVDVLADPSTSVIVNLIGLRLDDRPSFFAELLPALERSRVRCARPHRIAVDEAHHLLPEGWDPVEETLTAAPGTAARDRPSGAACTAAARSDRRRGPNR
jgi:hypothetical protein